MRLISRHDRNSMATRRRSALYMHGIYDRFWSLKDRLKYGRKNPIRWWQSTYQHYKPWRSRND
jgi:hypothetical protein